MVHKDIDRAVGLSYDGVHVYWTSVMAGDESIVRSKEDGSDVEVIVDAGKCAKLGTSYLLLT